jgi:hypothetical protein
MKMLTTMSTFVVGFFLGAMIIHSRTAAAQGSYNVSPVIEKFDAWGVWTPDNKLIFYSGWANGLFTTTKDPGTLALGRCLENLSFEQIVAMVDKRYADHPEAIHNPIGMEIVKAVTVAGGPCENIRVDLDTKNVACAADKTGSVSCSLAIQ